MASAPQPSRHNPKDTPFIDALRIPQAARKKILESLDLSASQRPKDSRRKHDRFEYRVADVPLTIVQGLVSDLRFMVQARNLSTGGMSFLHGGFLHQGADCRLLLKSASGMEKLILGKVVSCRYIMRNIHEVSVQFSERIDILDFCGPKPQVVSALEDSVHIPRFSGLALCATANKEERLLLAGWLSTTGLNVVEATSHGTALDKVKRFPFVLVVCDFSGSKLDTPKAIEAIRAAGFNRSLLAIVNEGETMEGVSGVVVRPLNNAEFNRTLMLACELPGVDSAGPIFSLLATDPGANELLIPYVEQIRTIAVQIEAALDRNDLAGALQSCQSIRSTAGGYGFPSLGDAASQALLALDVSREIQNAARHLKLLTEMCRRVNPGRPAEFPVADTKQS